MCRITSPFGCGCRYPIFNVITDETLPVRYQKMLPFMDARAPQLAANDAPAFSTGAALPLSAPAAATPAVCQPKAPPPSIPPFIMPVVPGTGQMGPAQATPTSDEEPGITFFQSTEASANVSGAAAPVQSAGLSAYEMERDRQVERNKRKLNELGLLGPLVPKPAKKPRTAAKPKPDPKPPKKPRPHRGQAASTRTAPVKPAVPVVPAAPVKPAVTVVPAAAVPVVPAAPAAVEPSPPVEPPAPVPQFKVVGSGAIKLRSNSSSLASFNGAQVPASLLEPPLLPSCCCPLLCSAFHIYLLSRWTLETSSRSWPRSAGGKKKSKRSGLR